MAEIFEKHAHTLYKLVDSKHWGVSKSGAHFIYRGAMIRSWKTLVKFLALDGVSLPVWEEMPYDYVTLTRITPFMAQVIRTNGAVL